MHRPTLLLLFALAPAPKPCTSTQQTPPTATSAFQTVRRRPKAIPFVSGTTALAAAQTRGLCSSAKNPPIIAIGMTYALKNDPVEGRARNHWAQCKRVLD